VFDFDPTPKQWTDDQVTGHNARSQLTQLTGGGTATAWRYDGIGRLANAQVNYTIGPSFPSDVAGQAEFWRQALGGSVINIPTGSTSIPGGLNQFNPGG
jgi:hypothetical protein